MSLSCYKHFDGLGLLIIVYVRHLVFHKPNGVISVVFSILKSNKVLKYMLYSNIIQIVFENNCHEINGAPR